MKSGFIAVILFIITSLPAMAVPLAASDTLRIDASGFRNLSTALASPITVGKTVVVSKLMDINNKTTDRAIAITASGKINVAKEKKLAINGPFSTGIAHVFTGEGRISFGGKSLAEVLPEWWGFVPFGRKDAALSNAAAINSALASYKVVRLNNCDTYIGATLVLKQHGSVLRGNGASRLIAHRTSATDSFAMIVNYNRKNATSDVYPDYIADIELDCAGQSLTGLNAKDIHVNNASGIHLRYADGSRIERVTVRRAGLAAMTIELSRNCVIYDCKSYINGYLSFSGVESDWSVRANGNAFSFTDGSHNKIIKCYAYKPRDLCFTLWNEQNSSITGCTGVENYAAVTSINGRGGASVEITSNHCNISDCTIKSVPIGIFVSSVNTRVDNNNILDCASGITLVATSDNSIVTGNNVVNTAVNSQSLSATGSKNILITNNVFNSYYNLIVQNNESLNLSHNKLISSASVTSVLIYNATPIATENNTIQSNLFTGKFTNAIQLTANNTVISGNTFIGGSASGSGVYLNNSNHVIIENNTFKNDPIKSFSPEYSISIHSAEAISDIRIIGNNISGYTTSDMTYPYGFRIQPTVMPLIDHTDLTKSLTSLNGLLNARPGSVITGYDKTRGKKKIIKTGTGNTGWVDN